MDVHKNATQLSMLEVATYRLPQTDRERERESWRAASLELLHTVQYIRIRKMPENFNVVEDYSLRYNLVSAICTWLLLRISDNGYFA